MYSNDLKKFILWILNISSKIWILKQFNPVLDLLLQPTERQKHKIVALEYWFTSADHLLTMNCPINSMISIIQSFANDSLADLPYWKYQLTRGLCSSYTAVFCFGSNLVTHLFYCFERNSTRAGNVNNVLVIKVNPVRL